MRAAVTVTTLLLSATVASAAPPGMVPPDAPSPDTVETTTSYRQYTLAADAIGIGLLVAGGFAEGPGGRDTETSNALFSIGSLSALFLAPVIHGARGHWDRAGKGVLLRGGMAAAGMMVAMAASPGCHKNAPQDSGDFLPPDFLCELDYVGYGLIGGLVVASVLDAAFMTNETSKPRSWTPVLAGTRDGGMRAGVAWSW